MSETMPKLTLELIKEKIGEPTNYDVLFIEDENVGHSYFHILDFGKFRIHITEYLDEEYYIRNFTGTMFICESLNEAIDRIKQIVGEQNIVV